MKPSMIAKIQAEAAAGKSISRIARDFGIAWATAEKYAKQPPVPPPEEEITEIEIPVSALDQYHYLVLIGGDGIAPRVAGAHVEGDLATLLRTAIAEGAHVRIFAVREMEVNIETISLLPKRKA